MAIIFFLYLGPEITQEILNGIANQPSSMYTFRVNEFRNLENIITQVAGAACTVSTAGMTLITVIDK